MSALDDVRHAMTDPPYLHEALEGLAKRIDAIEVRQRANEQHEPHCDLLQSQHMQRGTGVYVLPQPCTCWLSRCNTDIPHPAAETGPRRVEKFTWKQHASEAEGGEWYDAPSIPIMRKCGTCQCNQPICTEGHCMVCGAENPPEEKRT